MLSFLYGFSASLIGFSFHTLPFFKTHRIDHLSKLSFVTVCNCGFVVNSFPGFSLYPLVLFTNKDPGESIIRPSSRGPSYLTLTLKVYSGVYAHKDIVEGGKEHKDITSLLRIRKTLKIGEDTFEDLDEVSLSF